MKHRQHDEVAIFAREASCLRHCLASKGVVRLRDNHPFGPTRRTTREHHCSHIAQARFGPLGELLRWQPFEINVCLVDREQRDVSCSGSIDSCSLLCEETGDRAGALDMVFELRAAAHRIGWHNPTAEPDGRNPHRHERR